MIAFVGFCQKSRALVKKRQGWKYTAFCLDKILLQCIMLRKSVNKAAAKEYMQLPSATSAYGISYCWNCNLDQNWYTGDDNHKHTQEFLTCRDVTKHHTDFGLIITMQLKMITLNQDTDTDKESNVIHGQQMESVDSRQNSFSLRLHREAHVFQNENAVRKGVCLLPNPSFRSNLLQSVSTVKNENKNLRNVIVCLAHLRMCHPTLRDAEHRTTLQ